MRWHDFAGHEQVLILNLWAVHDAMQLRQSKAVYIT